MSYYRAVRAYSYFELGLFTALLVVWIGDLDPGLKRMIRKATRILTGAGSEPLQSAAGGI